MELPWLSVDSNIQSGIVLINRLKRPRFKLLLERIIAAKSQSIFTPDELQKFASSLKLSEKDTSLLVLTLQTIYRRSSEVILKPTVLQEQLQQTLALDAELSEEFVKQWTERTNRQFDLQSNLKLENMSWELNLQTASNFSGKQSIPHARIQMALSEGKRLTLELDEEELLKFYRTIENIQNKLDSL